MFSIQMKCQMDHVNQMAYKMDYVRCVKKRKQKLKCSMIHEHVHSKLLLLVMKQDFSVNECRI